MAKAQIKRRKQRAKQKAAKLRGLRRSAEERKLEAMLVKTRQKGTPLRLVESAPVPPRNGPCPLHPEHKLKRCPHGCLAMFRRHRDRVSGTVRVVHVDHDDPRRGKVAVERADVGSVSDIMRAL